jgi:hypothetical protein
MGEKRKAYKFLVGKPEGRPRRRLVNNIKMDAGEIGWGVIGRICLAQDRG